MSKLGRKSVSRIITSPLLRCVQTAAAAAVQLGVEEICLEPALAEGMLEDWYRSWAVPGADSTWGGPAHSRVGTPLPPAADLHPAAHQPASTLFLTPSEAQHALCASGPASVPGVRVSRTYEPLGRTDLDRVWPHFETEKQLAARMDTTVRALAERYPGETLLLCSHGGPCQHAYRQIMGPRARADLQAGYTALYVFVRDVTGSTSAGGGWDAPIAADQSHLAEAAKAAPDVADLAGPNDAAEQMKKRE